MEPSGLYLMWNMSGKPWSCGQDEGKLQDTISLVEKPSICLTDTNSGGSGFTETPAEACSDRRKLGKRALLRPEPLLLVHDAQKSSTRLGSLWRRSFLRSLWSFTVMLVVSEPRPLVSVTFRVCDVCQNAGCRMSQCLWAASTMHGFHDPWPLDLASTRWSC